MLKVKGVTGLLQGVYGQPAGVLSTLGANSRFVGDLEGRALFAGVDQNRHRAWDGKLQKRWTVDSGDQGCRCGCSLPGVGVVNCGCGDGMEQVRIVEEHYGAAGVRMIGIRKPGCPRFEVPGVFLMAGNSVWHGLLSCRIWKRSFVGYDAPPELSFIDETGLTPAEWKKKCRAWCIKPVISKPKLKGNLRMLEKWGLPHEKRRKIVRGSMALSSYTTGSLQRKLDWMVNEYGFNRAEVMRIVYTNPAHLNYSVDHQIKPFLAMFRAAGYTKEEIRGMILKHPVVLGFSKKLGTFSEFCFKSLGLTKWDVIRIVAKFPSSLGLSVENSLHPKVNFFLSLGFTKEEVGSLICGSPQILGVSIEQNAGVKVYKLASLGLTVPDIARIIKKSPCLLWRDYESTICTKVTWLQDTLGCNNKEVVSILTRAPRAFALHLTSWEGVLNTLSSELDDRVRSVTFLRANPVIFTLSESNLVDKIKFAQQTLGKHIDDVLNCPEYLSSSLHQTISMRVAFLKENERNVKSISLNVLSSKKLFNELFDEDVLEKFARGWTKKDKKGEPWS